MNAERLHPSRLVGTDFGAAGLRSDYALVAQRIWQRFAINN